MRGSRLEIASESNIGRKRSLNEDFHRTLVLPSRMGNLTLLAVADGMGGTEAGEWASKLAIEGLTEALRSYASLIDLGRPVVPLERVMEKAFQLAQRRIREQSLSNPARKGMGTTLTAILISEWNSRGVIGHIGDSRAYRYSRGKWVQITQDHSWVAQQVRQGVLSEAEAEAHPWKHMLTQALGLEDIRLDITPFTLSPGEVYVLATDGLYGLVPPEEWELGKDLKATLEDWVTRALVRGGNDNITVIAARYR